jgi:hypothetical protein
VLSESQFLRGTSEPASRRLSLRAGPLRMAFEPRDAFLRYVRVGDDEILRGLYSAVRDRNWDTILPQVSNVEVENDGDAFSVGFDVVCREREIDFAWRGTLTGSSEGVVTYTMSGEARSDFERNRVGFCVLHAPTSVAGRACRVEKEDGTIEDGVYPDLISPHQPFFDMRAISHELSPGVRATVRLKGDVFEMEDQRNWTDASYKTYCTPLAEPFPVALKMGDRVEQSVTIELEGDVHRDDEGAERPAVVSVATARSRPLPPIGLGVASQGGPLTETEIERLRRLHLSHLRVDVHFAGAVWKRQLAEAASQAAALEVDLEMALFVSDAARAELKSLAELATQLPVARCLVFHVAETTTSARWLDIAREELDGIDAPIVVGTNAYFTELNRERPPIEACDGVCYSLTPQVHAFDDASLMETLEAQPWTVESARHFCGDRPLHVTPVTLRPRFNSHATGPGLEVEEGALPSQVDPRQMSLFGAAWAVGSLATLAGADTASLTYFETVGWRGLMEREEGSPSDAFPSIPGAAFPMYHVFAWVGGMQGGDVMETRSDRPLRVQAMALNQDGWIRFLLANVTGAPQTARVECPGLTGAVRMEVLDLASVEVAMTDPQAFRRRKDFSDADSEDGCFSIDLGPYAVVCAKGMLE